MSGDRVNFPDQNRTKPFLRDDIALGVCEVGLLLMISALVLFEFWQMFYLNIQYFRELENYIELAMLVSAWLAIGYKEDLLLPTEEAAVVRGFVALGICMGWLELIFIIGRYPFRGGSFSVMFYNIIRKIFRYVISMFIMVAGHAFGFMILNYGSDINLDSFENPGKSFVMTLTMALGEFNFGDLYDAFDNSGEVDAKYISRTFSMILLISLILLGTVTMINLFIAVIISDLQDLKKDVFTQKLINMAQYCILIEDILPEYFLRDKKVTEKIR